MCVCVWRLGGEGVCVCVCEGKEENVCVCVCVEIRRNEFGNDDGRRRQEGEGYCNK